MRRLPYASLKPILIEIEYISRRKIAIGRQTEEIMSRPIPFSEKLPLMEEAQAEWEKLHKQERPLAEKRNQIIKEYLKNV